jgi:hypothetical protein
MAQLSLQEAMQQFLQKSKLKSGIQAAQIESVWEKLMGITIAKYTNSIKIVGHTLFITSEVAPLKSELMYQKDTIMERINEELGEKLITEVVIR